MRVFKASILSTKHEKPCSLTVCLTTVMLLPKKNVHFAISAFFAENFVTFMLWFMLMNSENN